MTKNNKIKSLSFEEAMNELEDLSKKVSENKFSLDELVDIIDRGNELSSYCMDKIKSAKLKISKINKLNIDNDTK